VNRLSRRRRPPTNEHGCRNHHGFTNEHGFSIVFVALMMVVMLSIAAFAIDLSQAYASRRQMQNAADDASLGATRALDKARRAGYANAALNAAVAATASDVANTRNGSQVALYSCTVIDRLQNAIASCGNSGGWTASAVNGGPAGVLVQAGVTQSTFFAGLIGQSTTTARTSAAATIQPLKLASGPFIICGNPLNDGYDILNPDGSINPTKTAALGTFPVQASQLPRCNGPSEFKGKARDGAATFTVPGIAVGDGGNGYSGEIHNIVANGVPCPNDGSLILDCDLVLPVADSTSGMDFHITALGVFHVIGDGSSNPKYTARFVTDLNTATGGQGAAANCGVGSLCLIKLVQ
jgi:Flp pilus assembly protein TadG